MAKHQDLEKRLKKELYVLAILFIIALATIAVMLTTNNDAEVTAWATISSNELHNFMSDCRSSGGVMDVRPNSAPHIVFMCMFMNENPQRSIEYTLAPGKRNK